MWTFVDQTREGRVDKASLTGAVVFCISETSGICRLPEKEI